MYVCLNYLSIFYLLLDNHNNVDVEALKKKIKISQVIACTVPFTVFLGTFRRKINGERGDSIHSFQQIYNK